ncbi:hypothetical protein GQ44DRAFT_42470 [Phaeosphaeriaceae sp. PMI808]|nr:hypothetical protein GQ44DRAFT_42470 [Phaeosphaeriaceae sp. PMI808]
MLSQPWTKSGQEAREGAHYEQLCTDAWFHICNTFGGSLPPGHYRNGHGHHVEVVSNDAGGTCRNSRPELCKPCPGQAWLPMEIQDHTWQRIWHFRWPYSNLFQYCRVIPRDVGLEPVGMVMHLGRMFPAFQSRQVIVSRPRLPNGNRGAPVYRHLMTPMTECDQSREVFLQLDNGEMEGFPAGYFHVSQCFGNVQPKRMKLGPGMQDMPSQMVMPVNGGSIWHDATPTQGRFEFEFEFQSMPAGQGGLPFQTLPPLQNGLEVPVMPTGQVEWVRPDMSATQDVVDLQNTPPELIGELLHVPTEEDWREFRDMSATQDVVDIQNTPPDQIGELLDVLTEEDWREFREMSAGQDEMEVPGVVVEAVEAVQESGVEVEEEEDLEDLEKTAAKEMAFLESLFEF